MGKKSIKKDKSIYQVSREKAELTREEASGLLFISEDTIEKIENGKRPARPEEVLNMSDVYKDALLCNAYCSKECAIGHQYVPSVKADNLQQIVLSMVSSLNFIQKEKDRLIDIVEDGVIDDSEMEDFIKIQHRLEKISIAIEALQFWVEGVIDSGEIDGKKLENIRKKIQK